jgi:hypothetical protein
MLILVPMIQSYRTGSSFSRLRVQRNMGARRLQAADGGGGGRIPYLVKERSPNSFGLLHFNDESILICIATMGLPATKVR